MKRMPILIIMLAMLTSCQTAQPPFALRGKSHLHDGGRHPALGHGFQAGNDGGCPGAHATDRSDQLATVCTSPGREAIHRSHLRLSRLQQVGWGRRL